MKETIGKMDKVSHWLKFKGTHIPSSLVLNPMIFKYLKKDFRILDVGCGFGKTIFELNKLGYKNLTGVDINSSGVSFAKAQSKRLNSNSQFIVCDAKKLKFNNEVFDFVITQAFWTTITNAKDRLVIAKEINRVLKPHGIIYIADFGKTWKISHYSQAYQNGITDGLEAGTFKVYNKHTGDFMYFAHHYTRNELSKLLSDSGFSKPLCHKSTTFTTQSGNRINGHVLVANKK